MRKGIIKIEENEYLCDIDINNFYLNLNIDTANYLSYCFNNDFDIEIEFDGISSIKMIKSLVFLSFHDDLVEISISFFELIYIDDWKESGF